MIIPWRECQSSIFTTEGLAFLARITTVFLVAYLLPIAQAGFNSAVHEPLALMATSGNEEFSGWLTQTWGFTQKILPLLLAGVVVSGFLPGRPGHGGVIPSQCIESALGDNSQPANTFAAREGALVSFATLTEAPILHGLLGAGTGEGPALTLPAMIVIRRVMGTKKTAVCAGLAVVLATLSSLLCGAMFSNSN